MEAMENSQQPQHGQQSQLPQQFPQNDIHSYKSKLQQYAQRAGLDLPMYHIKVKGEPHALRFTCSVMVDDETYESPSSFSQKKAAEQNAAKYALECIMEKRQEIGSSIISKNTTLCKAILNEFAAKLQIERPKYNPLQIQQVPVPLFVSTLEFRGVSYTGGPARTKKDAEKSVAHDVTLSILGRSEEDSTLLEIIRSKANLFSATQLPPDPSYAIRPEEGSDSASDEEQSIDATKSPSPLQTEITPPVQTYSTEQFKVTSESPAVESVMLVPSSSQNPATPTTMQVFANQGCEVTSSMHKVNSFQMFTGPPQNLITTQNDANQGCEVTCEPPHESRASVLCALQSTKRLSRNQKKKANKKARLID
ncbi:hypothetical protein V2J09_023317 [Rumex salicifolius]